MNWLLAGILAYLAIQMAIGLWVSRRVNTEVDYILAGRTLGLGVASFSIFATWFGAESIQGAAGTMYSDGLSGASADPFGYVLCIFFVGIFFARPLWNAGYTTFGDLFRARYSAGVEKFVILLIVPTSIIWAGAQVRAFGNVLSHASGLSIEMAITAAALFVMLYTTVGGLLADAWTDMVQGLAVIAGLLILLAHLVVSGDLQTAWAQVPAERLAILGDGTVPWYELLEAWAVPVVGSMLAVELLSRILGCRSADTARRACLTGSGLYLAIGAIPALIGLCGPYLMPGLDDAEQLIPALAQAHLGTWFYVVFAGALVSAILSTVDSCMLAGSTLVTHNVLLPLWPDLSERARLRASRLGVLAMGITAWILALRAESIKDLVETASAFGSAGVFVVACFGLFTAIGGPLSAWVALCT
ncbi:sodium:solute symporter family protein, partial [Luteitalea sp.]|uniref:sodium:solute symporter family protein n=1 Tax=Luteitalea sp. TaxID=2004800 RepID=UPI0037CB3962